MSSQANIRDIQILSDLKSAFGRFGEDTLQTLAALEKQFQEIMDDLQERHDHWRRLVDEAQEEVSGARDALNHCESQDKDEDGDSPDCSHEEEQVADAERQLAEYEEKLEIVKQWRHRIENQISHFEGYMHRMAKIASDRTGSAQAFLAKKIEILSGYVSGGFAATTVGIKDLRSQNESDRIHNRETIEELTSAEKQALRRYTGSEFRHINKTLREGIHDDVTLRVAELISNALKKLPYFRGTVYRGVSLDAETIKRYIPGQIILEKQFVSSSKHLDVADDFGQEKPRVIFIIQSKNGKLIAKASEFAYENEILFDKGTQFKILDRKFINDVWIITEEEL